MGYYVDPPDMTKEEWLKKFGTLITESMAGLHSAEGSDLLVVCLVNNGEFTAAGIAHDDNRRDYFLVPDGRPRRWYLVQRKLLDPYLKDNHAFELHKQSFF